MKPKSTKSQITVFLILGIVMVMVLVSVILLSRHATKKTSRQETLEAKEVSFDVQPIRNFVTECLSTVSKNGLRLMGSQGGYIFKSQGGTVIDYQETDEGIFFIENENSKVVYNILKPRFKFGDYYASVPNYPWKTFPYNDDNKIGQNFVAKDVFGINNLPPLTSFFGAHSMREQLINHVSNNIDSCLDFSVFENQGYNITKDEKSLSVDINEDDLVFRLQYKIIINNLITNEITRINDFFVRHQVRLGKLRNFVNSVIESDISDIKFSIINNTEEDFSVEITRDIYGKDDLIIITDKKSFIDSFNYKYIFARKNRNPTMFYLSPGEIVLPAFDEVGKFTIVQNDTLLGTQTLIALDPDEDFIDEGSFSIEPEPPITLIFPKIEFKISVSDAELEDYQTITVIRS